NWLGLRWLRRGSRRLATTAHEKDKTASGQEGESQADERQCAVGTRTGQRRRRGLDDRSEDLETRHLVRATDERVGPVTLLPGLEGDRANGVVRDVDRRGAGA